MDSPKPFANRYRVIGGKPSIELKLRSPRQLFDERDPAPFRDRDLDDDAARYILASYRDLRDQNQVRLSLYFESLGELGQSPNLIEKAIRAFFTFEADMKRRELRDIIHQGLLSLVIGITFLFTCTSFAQWMDGKGIGLWSSMMKEGLFIMGWVAMWRPVSIFLYEWWPIRADLLVLRRLSNIEVDILPLMQTEASIEPRAEIRAEPRSDSRAVASGEISKPQTVRVPLLPTRGLSSTS
jgi:hypothetical protein